MSNNRIVYRQDGSQVPIEATNVEALPQEASAPPFSSAPSAPPLESEEDCEEEMGNSERSSNPRGKRCKGHRKNKNRTFYRHGGRYGTQKSKRKRSRKIQSRKNKTRKKSNK